MGFALAMQWIGRGRYLLAGAGTRRSASECRDGDRAGKTEGTFGEPIATAGESSG